MSEAKKPKFHLGIVIFVSVLILVLTFTAYMLNTDLEETLAEERGQKVIVHDYTYDSSEE